MHADVGFNYRKYCGELVTSIRRTTPSAAWGPGQAVYGAFGVIVLKNSIENAARDLCNRV